MIDILELAKPEINKKKKVCELITQLRLLRKIGKSDKEIETVIRSLNLPLDFHLFIMKNYWELMDGSHKIYKMK